MQNILLVEPGYNNKFPPLGLMKIATYHRNKGDIVQFYKGEAPYGQIQSVDRVYITTLFTFHYAVTVKCISHYSKYCDHDSIYVGGITATLMPSDLEKDTKIHNIIQGQLLSSKILGYDDEVSIDTLPLDYDILDDTLYKYPAGDNYFAHTTRGCPRGCKFCAVRFLEPKFETTNNLIDQVKRVDEVYGQKRNLFMMDNNVLCSSHLTEIIKDIKSLGFTGEANYIWPNPLEQLLGKIRRRKIFGVDYSRQLIEIIGLLDNFSNRLKRYSKIYPEFNEVLSSLKKSDSIELSLENKKSYLLSTIEKYRTKTKMIRYVDFNQGIDARLINKRNIKILSKIPIKPFRLSCDDIKDIKIFGKATNLAIGNKIRHFSNYILYNWEDQPRDLWIRLNNAVSLYTKDAIKIDAYSFPMKYAPFDKKDRSYIGEYWNKKYLNAINLIINVTNGVVAKETDFFHEAFGANTKEFLEILIMPDEFIKYRHFFRDNGLQNYWKNIYRLLSKKDKEYLLQVLNENKLHEISKDTNYPKKILRILELYKVNKSQFDQNKLTPQAIINRIESL